MAPIKFEDDFKDKLEKRTIAPSKGAWDKLSERLEAEEETANNKGFWWIGIAASVIGILFAIFQFSSNSEKTVTPIIVDAPEVINDSDKTPVIEDLNSTAQETQVAVESSTEEKLVQPTNVGKQKPIKTYEAPTQIAKAPTPLSTKNEIDVIKAKQADVLSIESEKAQEVADAIYTLSETEAGVSNASIDSLLKAAQRDILISRMKNQDQAIVDAALLLQEVEFELDESFRDRVFKAIKDSYGSLKTAIAQRND
ncbi:hypothetical protein SAMN05421824_0958 [Hyunsoonleella jejuensis]|uniref:Uncharacterized protein n=1 Tax=Hyunsoonleella jejuensis TaxID=419940 RepID=A0A1H9CN28_9FLAO|nr:hypothetical protein [Hyunsoonleella jejuensis]SEQ02606.1 hypothetical protein SAMN05421824_0958 [Hyunsoonleella jejuensis]